MADTIEIVVKADGRQALANLEKLRQALVSVDEKASTSKARNELQSLQRVWMLTHRELMSGMRLLGITGGLLGGGLVAGLVAGGRALADFSAQGLQLHHLSKELGVSAESLERWRLAGKAAGISSEAAASDVETAMRKIQDLGRRGGYSDLYKELVESTADRTGHELAVALKREIDSGGTEQGFRFMMQKLQQYAKEGNQWGVTTIEKVLGLRGKGWERSTDLIEKIGKVTVVSAEDAQRLQLNMTLLGLQVDNFTTKLGNELMPVFTEMAGRFNAWLDTVEGQEFQKSLVDAVKQLEKLPWEDIRKGVGSTMSFVITTFKEGKKVIESFMWTFQQGIDAYNALEDFNRRKLRDERLSGVHGRDAQREEADRQKRWHPRSPRLPAPPKLLDKFFGNGGGGNNTPQRFSGGGDATDFSSVQRRAQTTENLNDQMRDVTDEVRRLNDLLRGGGDVAKSGDRGGAGNMGPTGGGGGGTDGGGGTTPGGGNDATPTGSSSPYRPAGTRQSTLLGSSASLGYEPGKFTPVQDLTTASGVSPAAAGSGGGVDATGKFPEGGSEGARGGSLYQKLLAEFRANPPKGVPPDGARFGITKGTPEEWARFGVAVANEESSFDPKTKNLGDPGGSFGVFQYAHNQVPGGNAYDVDASVKAFVRDSNQAATNPGGIGTKGQGGASILAQRFNVIGVRPGRTIRSLPLAGRIADKNNTPAQNPATNAKPIDVLKTATTSEIDLSGMTDPNRTKTAIAGTGAGDGTSLVRESSLGDPNKIRNLKVPDATRQALEYAAQQTGLRVDIQSGGQPSTGGRRKGSHRHDVTGGGAADFDLYDAEGKIVPHSDPRALQFVEHAAAAGAGGGGAAPGYMGPNRIHLGAGGSQIVYTGSKAFREAQQRGMARRATFDRSVLGKPAVPPPSITTLKTKRDDDDAATRKVIDAGLLNSMSVNNVKGNANVNIDVSGATKSADAGDSDKDLFNTTRSKGASQMPNTPTNTKDDKSSASSEDE